MNTVLGLLRMVKYHFLLFLIYVKSFFIHNFTKQKRVIYILSTPRHGNLGDHAIVFSQYKLFSELGYGKNIVEVNKDTLALFKKKIFRISKSKDLIVIDGGGNIGTLWLDEEYIMRDIIKTYTENPIIIMPQTAYFEDTHHGKKELQKSIQVYCAHQNLTIFCRDIDTYNLISSKFIGVKSFYVPDMVMFLTNISKNTDRYGALLFLREDVEKTFSNDAREQVISFLNDRKYSIKKSSTLVDQMVDFWQRKKLLRKKWEEFFSAELVVTDRLHGMLFAAITATPCLAIDNISHKVKNGYAWLLHLPYIVYCDNEECIKEKIEEVIEISRKKYTYNIAEIEESCAVLKKYLKTILEN